MGPTFFKCFLFHFLVPDAICMRADATIMTSVHPSVRLSVTLYIVDYDRVVQQIVKMDASQDRSVSWLPACRSRPGLCFPVIPNSTEKIHAESGMENVEDCTSAASNGSHVALSQHLLSFSFLILPKTLSATSVSGRSRHFPVARSVMCVCVPVALYLPWDILLLSY